MGTRKQFVQPSDNKTEDWARFKKASPFAHDVFERDPEWVTDLLADFPCKPVYPTVFKRIDTALTSIEESAAFMRALRIFRNCELARIAFCDVLRAVPLDDTLQSLSLLAEACIRAALNFAQARLQANFGIPRDHVGRAAQPIVLGMGKLGGLELNYSSDIDLIFAYDAAGETDGARGLSNEEFFARLARETSRLLATVTEDGFVFRVDTLLRPFGSVGAHALSADAMESYYQAHGREWERYALIKARPVAGDIAAGTALLERLQPFIYRRYLDYGALGALRELKGMIDRDAAKHGAEENLKLGPGGIRELEFIVQLFQLIRGGHDRNLRGPHLRPVLRYLGIAALLPEATAAALDQAYVLLRRCENAVQMYADEQTHRLPQSETRRQGMLAALGFEDWPALTARLDIARNDVSRAFAQVFTSGLKPVSASHSASGINILNFNSEALDTRLCELGFTSPFANLREAIIALRDSRLVRTLNDAARWRLARAIETTAAAAVRQPQPETAFIRALSVITAIAGRSTYLALLCERPAACEQLARLACASPWIVELLAQTPALLDVLLDPHLGTEAPDREALQSELHDQMQAVPIADGEAAMDVLRRYRQSMMLRIAAADLSNTLNLAQVSDRLTWLAEAIIAEALARARAQLEPQLGAPRRTNGEPAELAVIGYGKLGGFELGYGSDLDLVFVFETDSPEELTSGGVRSITAAEYFQRLAQRVVLILSAQTHSGRAYEVDLELRPSGNSGLVVTSLNGFTRYQRERAWTWEHQALLRARPVAGETALCDRIRQVRTEVLSHARDPALLRSEILAMRDKMRLNLERRNPAQWDIKQARGGLIDAEFLVQFLCLAHADEWPALIVYTDNWRQIEALIAASIIDAADGAALLVAERAYRSYMHRCALQQRPAMAEDGAFSQERAIVAALWHRHLEIP